MNFNSVHSILYNIGYEYFIQYFITRGNENILVLQYLLKLKTHQLPTNIRLHPPPHTHTHRNESMNAYIYIYLQVNRRLLMFTNLYPLFYYFEVTRTESVTFDPCTKVTITSVSYTHLFFSGCYESN